MIVATAKLTAEAQRRGGCAENVNGMTWFSYALSLRLCASAAGFPPFWPEH